MYSKRRGKHPISGHTRSRAEMSTSMYKIVLSENNKKPATDIMNVGYNEYRNKIGNLEEKSNG